ncbi:receptor-type tyrosine-protein phosphatase S-like [Ptychodera flava]|uniref:receptor-type tyrosine-protein phosphatase S-like n=1 Tax=Ptychodera flava TaxID=63121 RepID=UPI00396A336D
MRVTFIHLLQLLTGISVFSLGQGSIPPPTGLSAEALSSTSIKVTWNAVTDPDLTGYKIKCGLDSSIVQINDVSPNETETIFDSLKPYREYQILAQCQGPGTALGTIEFIYCRTLEDSPSAPPPDVTANALSFHAVAVTWSEVVEDSKNGVILGYRVLYNMESTPQDEHRVEVLEETTTVVNVTGLDAGTAYDFSVLAFTSVGDGPASDVVQESTFMPITTTAPTTVTKTNFMDTTQGKGDICATVPCQNNGTCIDEYLDYTCDCAVGWTGNNCDIADPDQISSPLVNTAVVVVSLVASVVIVVAVIAASVRLYNLKCAKNIITPVTSRAEMTQAAA